MAGMLVSRQVHDDAFQVFKSVHNLDDGIRKAEMLRVWKRNGLFFDESCQKTLPLQTQTVNMIRYEEI